MHKEIIGNATLYNGDCLEILPTIGQVDSIVTDPPFGMNYQSCHRKIKYSPIINDDSTRFLEWICQYKANHSKYIFTNWEKLINLKQPDSFITWIKNNHSAGDLKHGHAKRTENILFYGGKNHFWPKKRPTDIFYAARSINEFHSTEKPLFLMRQIIELTHGIVIDPFMGSGTTGMGCHDLNREFIGIEIDGKYFDIACKRIEQAQKQANLFISI